MKNIMQDRAQATRNQDDGVSAIAYDWPSAVFPYLDKWRNEYGPGVYIFNWKHTAIERNRYRNGKGD
ncbi:cytochrome P450 [Melia azedarach]|uniref:Cytochrome P450 n=1 Tax=Melia azedarach TaxID=155640 RepID=A0ACC1YVP8_MELAZ|nr:cytochrome P450 [Melia azedarach]